jgi:NADH-quinone oxidoreductase subunit C
MTVFAVQPEALKDTLVQILGTQASSVCVALGEVQVVVRAPDYMAVAMLLRDAPGCRFEQLIDLCGMDYSSFRDGTYEGPRYGVVLQLLSVSLNQRVRVKVLCPDDDFPVVDSVNSVWNAAKRLTCLASFLKATMIYAAS